MFDVLRRPARAFVVVLLAVALGGTSVLGQSESVPPPVGSSAPDAPLTSPRPSETPSVPRVRPLADSEVFGFLPYWELGGAAQSVDLDRLTTLAWFGVEANPRGKLVRQTSSGGVPPGYRGWTDPAWKALMAEAQAKGVRVVLTIERFSWDAGARARTIKLLGNPKSRTRLAQEIATELTATGADGVNLDFEPMPAEVRDDFTLFVRELRSVLEATRPGLQITFDITASVDTYDIPALVADDAADAVFLMAYDFIGSRATQSGSIAPLVEPETHFDIVTTVDQLLAVADPASVLLGLPWYGRAWTTKGPEPFSPTRSGRNLTGPGISLYEDALGIARENGRGYDPIAATAWTTYVRRGCDTCPEAWRQVWYDDVDGFGAKIRYALERGLRGIGMWALGYTGGLPGMWTVIDLAHGDLVDTTGPTGRASVTPGTLGKHAGLPVADGPVSVELRVTDEQGGSGPAFVRLSNDAAVDTTGELVDGATWPSTASVEWSPVDGQVVVPPAPQPTPTPKPGKKKSNKPRPTATPAPSEAPVYAGARAIHVQWRDIAGNWSTPVAVDVWYAPEGALGPTPSASPVASGSADAPAESTAPGSPGTSGPTGTPTPTPSPSSTRVGTPP